MNEVVNKLHYLLNQCNEKEQKKYKIRTFINLCNKVEPKEDIETNELISQNLDLLDALIRSDEIKFREYRKSFAKIQKIVREKFKFTEKGQLKSEYIGFGIAIGVALGSGFSTINAAFIGIGIPIGLAIGAAIGEKKEKEAEEQDRVY